MFALLALAVNIVYVSNIEYSFIEVLSLSIEACNGMQCIYLFKYLSKNNITIDIRISPSDTLCISSFICFTSNNIFFKIFFKGILTLPLHLSSVCQFGTLPVIFTESEDVDGNRIKIQLFIFM